MKRLAFYFAAALAILALARADSAATVHGTVTIPKPIPREILPSTIRISEGSRC